MATNSPHRRHAVELTGRRGECHVLDQFVDAVRAGGSRALVVRGEPVGGETALSRLDVALVTSWWGGGYAASGGGPQ